jgi:hypothetical protein
VVPVRMEGDKRSCRTLATAVMGVISQRLQFETSCFALRLKFCDSPLTSEVSSRWPFPDLSFLHILKTCLFHLAESTLSPLFFCHMFTANVAVYSYRVSADTGCGFLLHILINLYFVF